MYCFLTFLFRGMRFRHKESMAFTTRKSLLSRIRSGDEISWEEFYQIYRPLILLRGGDMGLNQTEKEDLVQFVVLEFFKNSKTFLYDKKKGRFRNYLKTIINHRAIDIIRKRRDHVVSIETEESGIEDLPANLDDRWDEEWISHMMTQALDELKKQIEPTTYQAFDFYALQNESPQKVANMLDISVSSVFVYKSRAISKLRQIITTIDD